MFDNAYSVRLVYLYNYQVGMVFLVFLNNVLVLVSDLDLLQWITEGGLATHNFVQMILFNINK